MNYLDQLRGLYVRSPRWIRRGGSVLIGMLPPAAVYGGVYRRIRSELATRCHDPSYVAAYQTAAVRHIIRNCVANSPFYRARLLEAFGRLPDSEMFSVADIGHLPVLTKDDVRQHAKEMLVCPESRAEIGSTSGSSGKPVTFYLDKDRGAKEWAFVNHIWARVGYTPGDRRAVLRGVHIAGADRRPWEYDLALRELRLSPFHLSEANLSLYLRLIKRYKISFIHGYPSAITALATHALAVSWKPPACLRGVLPVSESLFPHQREAISLAFGHVPVLAFYGLSEKVAIAGEIVGQPDTYEFEPLYGVTSLVDQAGAPVTQPGRSGRLVSTGLLSAVMPLLRYDTGDTAVLLQAPGQANGYRLRVSNIRSRWSQEFIVTSMETLISMTALNIHSASYASIKEFQFYQKVPGEVIVRIVPYPDHDHRSLNNFVGEIQRKVGQGVHFSLEIVESIAPNRRGKRSFIEQELDLRTRDFRVTAGNTTNELQSDRSARSHVR